MFFAKEKRAEIISKQPELSKDVATVGKMIDHFYTPNVEERNLSNAYNVDINDYYDLLRALHILCKDEDNKLYTINRIPKDELLFFLKHAYVNIYNSLKKYILLNGYNFEDYIYTSENFTLDRSSEINLMSLSKFFTFIILQ